MEGSRYLRDSRVCVCVYGETCRVSNLSSSRLTRTIDESNARILHEKERQMTIRERRDLAPLLQRVWHKYVQCLKDSQGRADENRRKSNFNRGISTRTLPLSPPRRAALTLRTGPDIGGRGGNFELSNLFVCIRFSEWPTAALHARDEFD